MKGAIVAGLEKLCTLTHWVTHRRPWLWIPRANHCPFAALSNRLEERWETGHWVKYTPGEGNS